MDYKEIKKRDREFGREEPKFDMKVYIILIASVTVFILAIATAIYFVGRNDNKKETTAPQPTAVVETVAPEITVSPEAEPEEDLPDIAG